MRKYSLHDLKVRKKFKHRCEKASYEKTGRNRVNEVLRAFLFFEDLFSFPFYSIFEMTDDISDSRMLQQRWIQFYKLFDQCGCFLYSQLKL